MTGALDPDTRHARLAGVLTVVVVLLATYFITTTYKVYSQTYDEGAHIACGMEWLSLGTYDYEALHPPLARVATALLPFLHGARSQGNAAMLVEGNAILNLHGDYWRNLTLSRLGVLPFFWLLCFVVYRFLAEHFGAWHGAIAVVLLAFCPPVLAHASLATTDAPLVAMFTWSLLRLWRLIEKPTVANGLVAGLVFALATLTKFTELPFYLLAAFFIFLFVGVQGRRFPVPVRLLVLGILVVPPTIWAGYRFSWVPVFTQHSMGPSAAAKLKNVSARERSLLTATRVPAGQFLRGIIMVKGTSTVGRFSYLLGRTYIGGRRAFFPVALLVKTPIPLIALFAVGLGCCAGVRRVRGKPVVVVLLAGAVCPLLVGIAGQMNIGLRHVLPVYPFVAMIAAIGAMELWRVGSGGARVALRVSVIGLLVWELGGTALAAPDLLPYFNEVAVRHADYFLVNSDLDWGQDLGRLETRLKAEHAGSLALDYFGDPDVDESGLPPHHALEPGERPTGWVAVSDADYIEEPEKWGWLAAYPFSWVGHSIRLYHLEALPGAMRPGRPTQSMEK